MRDPIMIRIFTATVMSILISSSGAASGKSGVELSHYLWKKRPLLLFAPSPKSPVYRLVPDSLSAHINQINDRHMVIIEVFENGMVRIDGKSDRRHSAKAFRQRFSPAEGKLTAVLVGKDGRLKLRQNGRLDLGEIFSFIDTMPMRQQEMRKSVE
jgi:hypothetical protein